MRITYLVMWGDRAGGTNRAVYTQANHLAAGHDVRVLNVVHDRPRPFYPLGPRVTVTHLLHEAEGSVTPARPRSYGDEVPALAVAPSALVRREEERHFNRLIDLELELALRQLDTDVLVTTSPALMAVAARFAPASVAIVHAEHRTSEARQSPGLPLLEHGPRVDAIVLLTSPSRDWLADVLGDAAPRLLVLPNALPDGFKPRSTLDSRTVVVAGRLVLGRQHAELIEAFARVVERCPDWTLRIYGDGPQRAGLQRRIADLQLHNHVLLMGAVPAMEWEWSKAAVGVLTSFTEGLPLVICEAFAAGVPFVSYDAPNGPRALITHGTDGLLVPVGNTDALVAALLRLIEDDAERRRLGAAALESAKRFDAGPIMARWEALFAELAAQPPQDRVAARLARDVAARATACEAAGHHRRLGQDEERLRERHPELSVSRGWLCQTNDRLTVAQVKQRNLDLVVDALDRAGVPYFVPYASSPLRHRVGVRQQHRARALQALKSAYGGEAVYVTPATRHGVLGADVVIDAFQPDGVAAPPAAVRVNRCYLSPQRSVHLGAEHGCDLEFWSEAGGVVESPACGHYPERVPVTLLTPATVTTGGRRYDSAAIFTESMAEGIDFPIDAVYTWVDGDDPRWLARKDAALRASGAVRPDDSEAVNASRFRNRDELRYSLRSLVMYAPWIRHVYLVTDDQVPPWLNPGSARITVVDHTEIFGGAGRLPSFNSHAIGAQLHRIDGLSEHYLYVNDDVFFARPVTPQQFFLSNGLAQFFLSPVTIDFGPASPDDPPHVSSTKNGRALLRRVFGKTILHRFLHTPQPQLRSLFGELEERFPQEIARTVGNQFRDHTDHAVASVMHHYYAYFTGRAVPGRIRYSYVNVSRAEHSERLDRLLAARDHDVFCLNDNDAGDLDPAAQERMLTAFMERYFPIPSEFERPPGAAGRAEAGTLTGRGLGDPT